jgi:glycosyltransferase involved in cell wall biosynthesis
MEKIWWRLACEFAQRGHDVLSISRRWEGLPHEEIINGVRVLRLPGNDHSSRLPINLILDARWSIQVLRHLPPADILISNNVLLPALAPRLKPAAGRLVANLNRYPKGQLSTWGGIARLQAASPAIARAALRQAPFLAPLINVTPNPVDLALFYPLTEPRPLHSGRPITLGFAGRLHPEKGLLLLAEAARLLATKTNLPPWEIVLRGPTDIPRGGGGHEFEARLLAAASPLVATGRWRHEPPEYDPERLAAAYRACDLFVYPTRAEFGEALPVAVLEALACGLPVVATDLACFHGVVRPGENGCVLPLGADAASWADTLGRLLSSPELLHRLSLRARAAVAHLDYPAQAESMLADFAHLSSVYSLAPAPRLPVV